MELRGPQQVGVSIADIRDRRSAGEHGSERGPPGESVVNDRSPHARQVTTEPARAESRLVIGAAAPVHLKTDRVTTHEYGRLAPK